jgi:hypothetical protein
VAASGDEGADALSWCRRMLVSLAAVVQGDSETTEVLLLR